MKNHYLHLTNNKMKHFTSCTYDKKDQIQSNEVTIQIHYCGICQFELYENTIELKNTSNIYLPGHEIIGQVIYKGADAKKVNIGDYVGIGCMVDSPIQGIEYFKKENDKTNFLNDMQHYAVSVTVNEQFVIPIPNSSDPKLIAPMLCTGTSIYKNCKIWNINKKDNVAIISSGATCDFAAKILQSRKAKVTLINILNNDKTTLNNQKGIKIIDNSSLKSLNAIEKSFDYLFWINPNKRQLDSYRNLIKTNGKIIVVECLLPLKKNYDMSLEINPKGTSELILEWIHETEEFVSFCAQHNIYPALETIELANIKNFLINFNESDLNLNYAINLNSYD
jgi:uncharacterized zinc-type alcohol dehydrogenase-like protein